MEGRRGDMLMVYIWDLPKIFLFRGGRRRSFTVDTGSDTSVLSSEDAEYWGLLDDVTPISGGGAGLEKVKGHLVVDLYTDLDVVLPQIRFTVAETNDSVVGLDFFFEHQCKIVIHPEDPDITFYEPQPQSIAIMNEFFSDDHPRLLVNLDVNRRLIQVQLDTGFQGFIGGRKEDAEELGLELEELENPVRFPSAAQDFVSSEVADDVSILLGNTEKKGKFYLIEGQHLICPLVGMDFIMGAILQFWATSESIGFDFHFPEDSPT